MIRVAITLVCLVAIAHAGPDDPQKLYADGTIHYNKGEYADAIALWQRAYDLTHAPGLLFNLGQAHRLKGDCTKALELYDAYLRAEPDASDRDQVNQAIGICKQIEVDRVEHERQAAAEAERRAREREAARAAEAEARLARVREAVARDRARRRVGLIGIEVGVVVAAIGGGFGYEADHYAGVVAHHTGEWDAAAQRAQDLGRRDNAIGAGLLIGGAAIVATGVTLWVIGSREHRVEAAVTVSATGGGLVVRGRL